MTDKVTMHQCECPNCSHQDDHADKIVHQQMNLLVSRLDEQQRRWYVALEANKLGYHGVSLMAQITGLHADTIRRNPICEEWLKHHQPHIFYTTFVWPRQLYPVLPADHALLFFCVDDFRHHQPKLVV